MASTILGIEYAKDSIKVVEVSYGRRLKIVNFGLIEGGAVSQERRGEQLLHMLHTRGMESKQVIVAFNGTGVEHRLLTLPPLSARELQFVMIREARKITTSKDMLWTYDVIQAREEIGIKKSQILLVTSESEGIRSMQQQLAACKLKVLQITTLAESLVNLVRNSGIRKKDAVKCLVHFSGNLVHVLFVRDGVLLLSRDILSDYSNVSQEEQIVRLMTEIKRSGLFFRQTFSQVNIDEFLFSGDNALLSALAAAAKEEFGVEADMLRFEDSLDTTGLRGDWNTLRFNLPALSVAIGAVWRKTPGTGINLLPNSKPSIQSGPGLGRAAKFLVPVSIALVFLSGSYYLAEKSSIDRKQLELKRKEAVIQQFLNQVAQDQAEHQLLANRNAFVVQLSRTPDWVEILRRLTFAIPDTAVLDDIRIERKQKFSVIIRGSVTTINLQRAYGDFNRFYGGMQTIHLLGTLSLVKPLAVSTDGGQSKLSFEVRCDLT